MAAAALLEAGGDALVRAGLYSGSSAPRAVVFPAGAALLFGYALAVNAPDWDFGRLLGLYIVFFFVVAQLIAWFAFHQKPSPSLLAGGLFIVLGGVIIAL